MHSVVAVVGVALAGGAAWWWQRQPVKPMEVSAAAAPASGAAPRAASGQGGPGGPGVPGASGLAAVEVARAEAATLTDDVLAVGSLKSAQGVMLRPEVSGRVSKLGFRDGEVVRQGQLLVQLDDTLQQAQLKQADAQASIARTNLQRSRELLAQSFVSQSAVDQNAAALEVADAQVALAKAQLARMRVVAPFTGTAGLRTVDVGDYVKDGADLVNLEDLSAMTVQFAVPERFAGRLKAGLPVELAVDALPGRSFKGRVLATDSQVDANGRALQVLAQVSNPGAVLKPGMFARPRVVFSVREGAVVVPEEALVPLGEKQYIFRVEDGAEGKKLSRKLEARLGLRLPGRVEVLQGLKPGDTVVTAGHGRLLRGDGLPVRVVDLSRAGGPPAKAGGAAAPGSGASGSVRGEAQPAGKPAAG